MCYTSLRIITDIITPSRVMHITHITHYYILLRILRMITLFTLHFAYFLYCKSNQHKLLPHENNSLMLLTTCPLGQALAGSQHFHFYLKLPTKQSLVLLATSCPTQQSVQIWRDLPPAAAEVPDMWCGAWNVVDRPVDRNHWDHYWNHHCNLNLVDLGLQTKKFNCVILAKLSNIFDYSIIHNNV